MMKDKQSIFLFRLQDNKADLVINYYVDDVLERVMSFLNIDTPMYNDADDPTKLAEHTIIDWTINRHDVLALEKIFKSKCKGLKKKRSLIKNRRDNAEIQNQLDDKSKIIKLEIKEEIDPCATENMPINRSDSSENYLANVTSYNNANGETSANNTNVIIMNGVADYTETVTANEDITNANSNDTNTANSESGCIIKSEVESSDQHKVNTTEQISTNGIINVD